jgi:hypothetical protein
MTKEQIQEFFEQVKNKKIVVLSQNGTIKRFGWKTHYFVPKDLQFDPNNLKMPSMNGITYSNDGKIYGNEKFLVNNGFNLSTIGTKWAYFEQQATPSAKIDSNVCECGSDAVGSPKHSNWCQKYKVA